MVKTKLRARKPRLPLATAATDAVSLQDGVLDVDEFAETIPFNYAITAFGADFTVDGLIKRLREDDVFIPLFSLPVEPGAARFQREYVWKKMQADRFVESLLLGLPVPGIFLVKEDDGRHLVLDGHQRLETLYRFYENEWEEGAFVLEHVQERFENLSYGDLDSVDKRRLDDSILHATIIRQDEPSEDRSSIYLIFERLNSGGTSLHPQEIRVALYHGPFVQLLTQLNTHPSWRALFGRKSPRLKDIELILRFFALLESSAAYRRPMKGFLNSYMARRRRIDEPLAAEMRRIFEDTTDLILRAIGPKAFKPKRTVNAALVDAVMVAIAKKLRSGGDIRRMRSLRSAYMKLMDDKVFQLVISRSTADEESVAARLKLAAKAFATVA